MPEQDRDRNRTQINIRLDNDLLTAIRQYCDANDITQTEFLTNAAKIQLGIPIALEDEEESIVCQLAVKVDLVEKRLEKLEAGAFRSHRQIDLAMR